MKVMVAMSGGVDSSVAAALLLEQGYDVEGVMLHLWAEPGARENACCSLQAQSDAAKVADILGIPFRVLDVAELFRRSVVEYFVATYARGRTPNPCIVCNKVVRFGFLMEHALERGFEFLATGHYARVQRLPVGEYRLLRGIDVGKDQSYVLYTLTQERLAHLLLPVGEYTKPQVREMARRYGLPVAEKAESQDLCFAADGDYRGFLARHAPEALRPGPILDIRGNVLGEHRGLAFYTIGQRKGLGLTVGEPLYVIEMDGERNAIVVGPGSALGRSYLVADEVNWISGSPPSGSIDAEVKIRYRSVPAPAVVTPLSADRVEIAFQRTMRDITPGQSAVFYVGDVCLGGGVIGKVW